MFGTDQGIADNYHAPSKLYKWNGNSFVEFQSFPEANTWKHFVINNEHYLSAANSDFLKTYKWNGSVFAEFQSVPVSGGFPVHDCEFFTIGTNYYMAVARMSDDLYLYKWGSTGFVFFQTISNEDVWDVEFFTIGSNYYLATAVDASFPLLNHRIYRWDGNQFVEFQAISTGSSIAFKWKHFTIGTDHYLAFYDATDLKIYKWNGTNFLIFQTVPTTYWGMEFYAIGTDSYLIFGNSPSKIYKWNGTNFAEFQYISITPASSSITDWKHFMISNDHYLAMANFTDSSQNVNQNSKIYKWGNSSLTLPNIETNCKTPISIPITLNNLTGVSIASIDITVAFDSSVIKPSTTPATLSGGILSSYGLTPNPNVSGQITLSIYGTGTLSTASGVIAYLNFDVIGASGSTTPLTFTKFNVNSSAASKTDGSVKVTGCNVSGHVGYYPSPTTIHISNAQAKLGTITPVNTDSVGNYTITATSGTNPLSVSKTDELGGVSATDAADISSYVVGLTTFNCYQKIAADVNRDGQIDSTDASLAARYSIKLINCLQYNDLTKSCNSTIDWVFTPNPITSCPTIPVTFTADRSVSTPPSATGQDFIGIRLGDVTGNWAQSKIRSRRDRLETRDGASCNLTVTPGSSLKIPVALSQATAVRGINIEAGFDSAVLRADSITTEGGILGCKNYNLVTNTTVSGSISAAISGTANFNGSGDVAYINFTVIGQAQTSTTLNLTKFEVNEVTASGGLVCGASVLSDIDGDKKIGLPEVIYALQCIAGLRDACACNANLEKVIQILRVVTGL